MSLKLKRYVSTVLLLFYLAASSVATVHGSTSLNSQNNQQASYSESCHGNKHKAADDTLNSSACEMFCTVMSQVISTNFIVTDVNSISNSVVNLTHIELPSIPTTIDPRPPKLVK